MPRYDVQICDEVWKYYRIHIIADNEQQARDKAKEIWDLTGPLEFAYEPGEDDGGGSIVTDCKEIA
jgi:hypothetical protein